MTRRRWTRTPATSKGPAGCGGCDYDLRGIPVGGRCPECGTVVPEPPAAPAVDRGRPDHRDSGLHVVAACQYLAIIPMSGLLLPGCAGPTLGVISVFGPVGRLVALRSGWRRSPLREIEPEGLGPLLHRLAAVETCFAVAYLAVIIGLLPDLAAFPILTAYAVMATISVSVTNFRLSRIFDGWEFQLPALLARLGFGAGCLAGLSTITIIAVWIARPNPDITAMLGVIGVAFGIITSLLAVFAARDGIGRVEAVLITDLIEAHAEEIGREPIPLADRFRSPRVSDPLPIEPERPPVRKDLE
ncbi:MAG: hypothetical protein CMJ54_12050 [Planctomycetaceae bacterium]|nr:hypothetical protein [Planctomycetaceae bacterium]